MRARSLLPKEHGAYGQLALPLLSALTLKTPTLAALTLTAAFVAAFVAHEPLLVIVGARGTRARREDGARARTWLMGLLGLAAVGAAFGAREGGPAVTASLALPAALAAALAPFIATRRERSAPGEIVASTALASTSVPVALASGVPLTAVLTVWCVWALGFAASTLVIRGVVALARGQADPRLAMRALAAALVLGGAAALAATGRVAVALPLAVAPLCLASIALAIVRPRAARIKAVGWSIVAAGLATVFILALTLR